MSRHQAIVLTCTMLALVISLSGCGGGGDNSTPPPPSGTATLSGTVVRADNIASPIVGAQVTIIATGAVATTNALGQFAIHNLPAGQLTVAATAPLDPNYQPQNIVATMLAAQTTTANIALLPTAVGDTVSVRISPEHPSVEISGQIAFHSEVSNTGGVVPVAPTWLLVGAVGAISPDGTFTGDAVGAGTVTAVAGQVSASTAVTVTPAAPPVITTVVVSPTSVGPSGGNVQITCAVEDAQGVAAVQAWILLPGGGESDIGMPLVAGTTLSGTYRISYAVPANSNVPDSDGNQAPQTYHVRIWAQDATTMSDQSGLFDFQAEGVTAPPPPPPP